jgi:hypothetical protein
VYVSPSGKEKQGEWVDGKRVRWLNDDGKGDDMPRD